MKIEKEERHRKLVIKELTRFKRSHCAKLHYIKKRSAELVIEMITNECRYDIEIIKLEIAHIENKSNLWR